MASTQITIDTGQARGLQEMGTEFREEGERLREAAASATRKGPGMLAKAETYLGWADLLDALVEQVPQDVMSPPPPPQWVADGYALVPGQRWPHQLADDGTWIHPSNDDEYAEGVVAYPATTEDLIEAGAVRLPAIVAAEQRVTGASAEAPQGEATEDEAEPETDLADETGADEDEQAPHQDAEPEDDVEDSVDGEQAPHQDAEPEDDVEDSVDGEQADAETVSLALLAQAHVDDGKPDDYPEEVVLPQLTTED